MVGQVKGEDLAGSGFQGVGVVGEQNQGGETGRADGIALGDGLGGIADGIQRVGDVTYLSRQFRHFGDAAGVVGDRSVSVESNDDSRHGEHGGGGNCQTVEATDRVGGPDRGAHREYRPGG